MPLFAQCVDHAPLDGPAASPTDGDAHFVVTRQAVELSLQLSGFRGQLLPRRQHRSPSGTVHLSVGPLQPLVQGTVPEAPCSGSTRSLRSLQTSRVHPRQAPEHRIPAQAYKNCLCSVQLASLDKGLFLLTPSKADCVSGASIEEIPGDSGILSLSLLSLLSFFSPPSSTPAPTLQSPLFPLCCISARVLQSRGCPLYCFS